MKKAISKHFKNPSNDEPYVRLSLWKADNVIRKTLGAITFAVLLVSCNSKSTGKKFEVSGMITNNPAKMIYLEEVPMTTM